MSCSVPFGLKSPLSTHASTKPDPFIWFPIALWKHIDIWRLPSCTTSFFWYSSTVHFSSTSLQNKAWSTVRTVCCYHSAADMSMHLLTTVLRVPTSWAVKSLRSSRADDICWLITLLTENRQFQVNFQSPLQGHNWTHSNWFYIALHMELNELSRITWQILNFNSAVSVRTVDVKQYKARLNAFKTSARF